MVAVMVAVVVPGLELETSSPECTLSFCTLYFSFSQSFVFLCLSQNLFFSHRALHTGSASEQFTSLEVGKNQKKKNKNDRLEMLMHPQKLTCYVREMKNKQCMGFVYLFR